MFDSLREWHLVSARAIFTRHQNHGSKIEEYIPISYMLHSCQKKKIVYKMLFIFKKIFSFNAG